MLICKRCSLPAFVLDNGFCDDCDRINEWEGSNAPTIPGALSKRPKIFYSDISKESITPTIIAAMRLNEKRFQA
jgi:hypothetical protein